MDLAILATFGAIAAGNYLAWSNINYKKFSGIGLRKLPCVKVKKNYRAFFIMW